MTLLGYFGGKAPNKVFIAILLGAIAGVSYALLIPIVMAGVSPEDSRFPLEEVAPLYFLGFEVAKPQLAKLFLLTCMVILVTQALSQIILTHVSLEVTAELRISMYQRILASKIVDLEEIGSSKLIATLTTDVLRIIQGARVFPELLTNGITLIGMLGFLLYLNPEVFWFVICAILFGVATYQLPMFFAGRFFKRSREKIDALQEAIRGLIFGIKELSLSKRKREEYLRDILIANEESILRESKRGNTISQIATNYGNLVNFFVIGVITFIFVSYHSISAQELTGVVMALLYITGPVAMLLNVIPVLLMAKVSVNKVEQVLKRTASSTSGIEVADVPPWDAMILKGVTYNHESHGNERPFSIGPIDISIKRGEVTLITGGNGSGKSTLAKLISLHYPSREGSIQFDNTYLEESKISAFREHTCAIYSDYYLFDRLLGVATDVSKLDIDHHLKVLNLEGKISYEDGKFSTLKLSDGQKRRLALLVTFAENRTLYVFDEWAADQDPEFKQVFYKQLVPSLKDKGKAIVIVSHDDRYFDVADQMIVMEDGQVARTIKRPVD